MSTFRKLEAQILRDGVLFEDADFSACSQVLGETIIPKGIEWKRPKEIVEDPKFLKEKDDPLDIVPSGNCGFVSALCILENNQALLAKVIPREQSFKGNYAGIFCFNFFRFGKWTEVIIDDRLPMTSDNYVYTCNYKPEHNGFWGPLIEKAYAKLLGSYKAIQGVLFKDMIVDLTGGILECHTLKHDEDVVPCHLSYEAIETALKSGAIVGIATWVDEKGNALRKPAQMPNGLTQGVVYTVIDTAKRNYNETENQLLKLYNFKDKQLWPGAWNPQSNEWLSLTDKDKLSMQTNQNEFWISYEDVLKHFEQTDIAHLDNEAFQVIYDGSWLRGITAGGNNQNSTNKDCYYCNPQYHLTVRLRNCDKDNDYCTLMISVTQKDTYQRHSKVFRQKSPQPYIIGFDVFLVEDGVPEQLDRGNVEDRATTVSCVRQTQTETAEREVSARLCLPPGTYCVIPFTQKPNQEADFVLRLHASTEIYSCFIDEPVGPIQSRSVKKMDASQMILDTELHKDSFLKYSNDESCIDVRELRMLLNHLFRKDLGDSGGGLSMEPCRSLLAMVDENGLGTLGFEETKKVWESLQHWRLIFKKYDNNKSGFIETFDIKKIFKDIGFNLSSAMTAVIAKRYGGKQEMVSLEDFVLCSSKFLSLYAAFLKFVKASKTKKAEINLEQWMCTTMFF